MKNHIVAVTLSLAIFGCGDPAPGTLEIRIYGEGFIEEGIPAAELSDGWAVKFDRFLVGVSDVKAARGHGAPDLTDAQQRIFDVATPSMGKGALVATAMVPGGAFNHVSYRIKPATAGAMAAPGLVAGALDGMVAAGEAVRVEGKATKDGKTVSFAWGFKASVFHRECRGTAKVDGGSAATQITIHGDHLFYDDLFAAEPKVAFDIIAASDKDGDGTVTAAELAGKDISKEARYQVGSTKITNLWDFISRQVTTVGHIDGEGHCEITLE